MKQQRSIQVRSVGDDGRTFTAMAVRYNVVDDYRTKFMPGCFNAGLEQRLPKIAWGHDWSDIVGRVTAVEDTPEGLVIHARLSDPEAVPRARQAMAQLRDGDVEDVSVGFSVPEGGSRTRDGIVEFVRADLDEVSLVLRGAVPGAKVMALRSSQMIPAEVAGQIIAKLSQGNIDLLEALQAVKAAAVEPMAHEDQDADPEPHIIEHDPALPAVPGTTEVPDEVELPVEPGETVAPNTEPGADEATDDDDDEKAKAELQAVLADADAALALAGY